MFLKKGEMNETAFLESVIVSCMYRIAGKLDGDLNLANWRFWTATAKVYSRQIYELRTFMLPSASHRQI